METGTTFKAQYTMKVFDNENICMFVIYFTNKQSYSLGNRTHGIKNNK